VDILKIGELWAIPIMLRFALVENLRWVAARIVVNRIERNRAKHWADLMTDIFTVAQATKAVANQCKDL